MKIEITDKVETLVECGFPVEEVFRSLLLQYPDSKYICDTLRINRRKLIGVVLTEERLDDTCNESLKEALLNTTYGDYIVKLTQEVDSTLLSYLLTYICKDSNDPHSVKSEILKVLSTDINGGDSH